ncbi:MAG TPA: cellulase family glycosylhydrolase, partial [Polyangiaceae bacterium]|nr:cellulase family glycosylhydrolase [Polyangiaceae bacterium]
MNPAFALRATKHSLVAASLAWLAASCGPPPCPSVAGTGPAASSVTVAGGAAAVAVATPAVAKEPSEFTHTTAELFAKAKFGWNLGNSLDVPEGETAWGNPATTQELMNAVAKAGFGIVRIPVTWSKHMGAAPDFAIDPAYFARVSEVVGYAHSAGLYAVVNVHHDGADNFKGVEWITLNDEQGKTSPENNAAVRARFTTVWTQIAKYFANYGEELLFESMNEIHDGYGAP